MKTIDSIIRGGKTFVDKLFNITKNRIERAINSAFDSIEESIYTEEVAKINALKKLGDASESATTMKDIFNEYHEACEKIRMWELYREDMKQLKADLNVEVEED